MPRTTLSPVLLAGGLALAAVALLAPPAQVAHADGGSAASSDTATATMSPEPVAAAPSLVLTASTTQVVYGVKLGLIGELRDAAGAPAAGQRLDLFSRTQGQSGRVLVGTTNTDANGRGQILLVPRTSAEYQLRYAGSDALARTDSNLVASNVRPRLVAGFTPAGIALKQSSVLRGTLAPAYAGARISIRRRGGDGTYREVTAVGVDRNGAFRWTVTPGVVGSSVFRVVLPAAPAHLLAYSNPFNLQVDPRNLRLGNSGGDVASLERRLAAVKADVGRIDGRFDSDLFHAVLTFQKSQGLARTGVYDRATSARLAAPQPVRLRHPAAGRAIEVNLRQQVLYVSEGGVLRRMVDISSGNNEKYVSQGKTYTAFTPTGSFRIERKIDGVRVSHLGELYRPGYFYRGWAVHGSNSVPNYPASHGCLRVTNSVQDRLFPLLTVGTPVHVYAG